MLNERSSNTMPRSSQQNREMRAESQRRLLAAAHATFVRLGYDRATIRDIAQEAGVAQGLLYNYFRSKEDLLREVFRAGARDVAEALGAADAAGTPAEQLERVIRRSFEIVRERRDFWLLSYMLRFQPRTAAWLGDELMAWAAAVRGQLAVLLRKVGHRDSAALSRVLFGAIDGLAQHYALNADTFPLDPTVDCLVRHFCQPPAEAAPATRATTRGRRGGSTTPARRGPRS